ncbi:hypothetical protein EUGRSUZ_H02631 [Eucalyptus grandis]|uniref:C2H2-type domain-containing protein n=2 Tax=Eucalyptus grandis TaxID=71139 RepID=A0A059B110_EUCGR|nr:hypothetical protein EUGRSUZ_H02631 [Eucalyptus grandis]
MEGQDHGKDHSSSGHEGHGVHLCHKCGWPFPNPHPSAKHRRAHKKVCGKVEGYKLAGSDENPHVNVSDDERSDDEHKTPGPKVEGGSEVELGKNAAPKRMISMEEDVFSDAATNFPDGGLNTQSEGLLHDDESDCISRKISDNNPTVEVSGESATTEVILKDPHLVGSGTEDKVAASGVTNDKLSSENNIQGPFTGPFISEQEQSAEKFSDMLNDKRNESVPGSSLLQPEDPVESSAEVKTMTDGETVKAFCEDNTSQETDVKLDKGITGSQVPCKDDEEISGVMPSDGGLQLGKSGDILFSEVSPSGLAPDLSSEQLDVSADIPQETVDKAQELELSIPVDPVDSHAKTLGETGNFHVLTVPRDIPMIEDAEKFIEDFKDHKGVKVLQTDDLGSVPTIGQKEDDSVPVSEDFSSPNLKVQEEVAEVSSNVYISGTNLGQELEILKPVDEDAPLQSDVILSQASINTHESQGLNEVETAKEALTTAVEESNVPVKAENMEPKDVVNSSSQIEVPVDDMKSSTDLNTVVALMDTEGHETSGITGEIDSTNNVISVIETPHIVGDAEKKQNMDESSVESQIIPESTGMQSIVQDNMINSEGDVCRDQGNHVKDLDVAGTDVADGHVLGNNIKKENAAESTSTGSLQGCEDTAENIIHRLETKSEIVYGALNTQEGAKEGEKSGKVEIQGACDTEVRTSVHELSHEGDSRIKELTSEEHHKKENLLSTAIANTATSDISVPGLSSPLQDESNKKFVEQQLAGSVHDASVDSSSRADSLEGNWGSISVLSTQSDAPVAVEPEVFPPKEPQSMTDAAKSNLKLENIESGGKNSEKTDVFEPPSFMTLVEATNNQNPAIAVQNDNQSKSASEQAGWFPSLPHAANDSQGRKKNEEIIAKVTNWSTGKQHSPLKSLLVEANRESKLKSASPKESPAPIVAKDDDAVKDSDKNIASATTVSSILGSSEAADLGAAMKEMDQEWNSPARYPTDIKREKRKVKGRPYWAQFMCCSSVN